MKRIVSLSVILLLLGFSFSACGKKGGTAAGSATAESMLNLLPKETRGVIIVDLHRIMATEAAAKALKDEKNAEKYQKFIQESGIDPQKDVYFLVVGLSGALSAMDQEGAVVVNLRYNKDILLAKLKEKSEGLTEEAYSGVTIYKNLEPEEKGRTGVGAFLDESNIVIGSESGVKGVIDCYQKKAESVLKNEELGKIMKGVNRSAMVWSAFAIPPEAMKEAAEKNPMMGSLAGITAVSLTFDYNNKTYQAELKAMGASEEQNKQMADLLTGLKSLGGAAASQDPAVGELMNKITISSAADNVKISASLPEDLIEKLQKSAQNKIKSAIGQEPKEEKSGDEESR